MWVIFFFFFQRCAMLRRLKLKGTNPTKTNNISRKSPRSCFGNFSRCLAARRSFLAAGLTHRVKGCPNRFCAWSAQATMDRVVMYKFPFKWGGLNSLVTRECIINIIFPPQSCIGCDLIHAWWEKVFCNKQETQIRANLKHQYIKTVHQNQNRTMQHSGVRALLKLPIVFWSRISIPAGSTKLKSWADAWPHCLEFKQWSCASVDIKYVRKLYNSIRKRTGENWRKLGITETKQLLPKTPVVFLLLVAPEHTTAQTLVFSISDL